MQRYNLIACGGTFDLFHKGHKEFLRFAIAQSNTVLVGITSDQYKDGKRLAVAPYDVRKNAVLSFLEKEGVLSRVTIVSIDDMYGPAITKSFPLEAISVSEKTIPGAEIINKKRESLGLQKLAILVCHIEKAEDGGEISSSRIRLGEIDREGKLYARPEFLSCPLSLPEEVRQELKKPLGLLVTDHKALFQQLDPAKTITVGDVVTKLGNDEFFGQVVSVVDFIVQREKKYTAIIDLGFSGSEEVISVKNPAGFLTPELFRAVQAVFRQLQASTRFIICVTGEEDLAVLPVLLAAPLGFVVLYGQPHTGMVQIIVTEAVKNRARSIVFRFTS